MKYFLLHLIALSISQVSAQTATNTVSSNTQHIVDDLPSNVVKKIEQHISRHPDSSKFVILFASLDSSKYIVTIMEGLSKSSSFKDIDETLIQKTSRFVRVNELLIRMITWEDIIFSDFGTVTYPEAKSKKRKVGKKRIHFTTDAYSITFDRSGKIY